MYMYVHVCALHDSPIDFPDVVFWHVMSLSGPEGLGVYLERLYKINVYDTCV